MPKFLIVAATKQEVEPILTRHDIVITEAEGLYKSKLPGIDLSVLITGVGMVNTAFIMGKYSHEKFDYLINIGICGAIDRALKIGEVVNVNCDTLSEMGAENDNEFIKYSDLKLGGINFYNNKFEANYLPFDTLKKVSGITVNTVHGNEASIQKIISLFNPDVESMEGAAFFRACNGATVEYCQLRAISNYVEKRDKSKWEIALAIKNVNEFAIKLMEDLNNKQQFI